MLDVVTSNPGRPKKNWALLNRNFIKVVVQKLYGFVGD
jgi:hypothetical protein